MTVTFKNESDDLLICHWFLNTELKKGSFPPESLEVVVSVVKPASFGKKPKKRY